MSNCEGTCEYVLDPDDPETWGGEEEDECYIDEDVLNEDGVWTCPHEVEDRQEFCIFHRPLNKKCSEEVNNKIKQIVNDSQKNSNSNRSIKLIGSQLFTIELTSFQDVESKVDLSYSRLLEGIYFNNNTVDTELIFNGTVFNGVVNFQNTTFSEDIIFKNSIFLASVDFSDVIFKNEANFQKAVFESPSIFTNDSFQHVSDFMHSKFKSSIEFDGVDFHREAAFHRAEFHTVSNFSHSTFYKRVSFDFSKFFTVEKENDLENIDTTQRLVSDFSHCEFNGVCHFSNITAYRDIVFAKAKFHDEVWFKNIKLKKSINFTEAEINNGGHFEETLLKNAKFDKADLTGAMFNNATIHFANFESSLLSRASLFGADLRGGKLNGAVLSDARIDENTKFLGHPKDKKEDSPHTFSSIFSRPCCEYDPKYNNSRNIIKKIQDLTVQNLCRPRDKLNSLEKKSREKKEKEKLNNVKNNSGRTVDKAKSVYRALEDLAGKAARSRLQSQCFVRRQDLEKDEYKRVALGRENKQDENITWQNRLIAFARYARAKSARIVLLYGESPWRIIAVAGFFITLFTFLYPIWGLDPAGDSSTITYAQFPERLEESLYFSTLTFMVGPVDYEPLGLGQWIAMVNTAIGPILIALLVFVFGRRAAR